MRGDDARRRSRMRSTLGRADQRARTAWRLGPFGTLRAVVRAGRSTRRQIGLVRPAADAAAAAIPFSGGLEVADAGLFTGFTELVPKTPPEALLELLWYERLAAEGAETFLVARTADGAPTFTTWMLDAAAQAAHADRFLEGFHRLADDELLLEGVFVFPWARRRGVATAGIAAACAWAAAAGKARVWSYPYLDNERVLPAFARCGFEARHVRVEDARLGQARGRREHLSAADLALWDAARNTEYPADGNCIPPWTIHP